MANYTIDINMNGDYEEKQSPIAGDNTSIKDPQKEAQKTQDKALAGLKTMVANQVVKPVINSIKSYAQNNIETLTGSVGLQEAVDLGFNIVNEGQNLVSYASAGASFGGGVGAVVGVVIGIASKAIEIASRQAQLNLQARTEDRQLSYTRNRAGMPMYNNSRRGV